MTELLSPVQRLYDFYEQATGKKLKDLRHEGEHGTYYTGVVRMTDPPPKNALGWSVIGIRQCEVCSRWLEDGQGMFHDHHEWSGKDGKDFSKGRCMRCATPEWIHRLMGPPQVDKRALASAWAHRRRKPKGQPQTKPTKEKAA